MRGPVEPIEAALPGWAIDAFEVATHAGDYRVLVAVSVVVWLAFERDRGPWPVIAVLGAIGLATTAKMTFGLPRPAGAGIGGYGFPSGHALGATVAYGVLVYAVRTRPVAIAAAVVVAIVSVSRVAIGVHYPADVLAGVALGLAYLAVVSTVFTQSTGRCACPGKTHLRELFDR